MATIINKSMRRFMVISPTEEKDKKYEAGQRFIDGGYIALGWYHQDFTGWSIDQIIDDIKLQNFADEDIAIKSYSDFLALEVGDIVAVTVVNKCILAIGRVTSGYKFEKYKHDTGAPTKEKFYSHFREIDWLITERQDRKSIQKEEDEKYWKPRGTSHLYSEVPKFIKRLISLDKPTELVDLELIGYEGKIREHLSSHKRVERDKDFVKKYKTKFSYIKTCPGCALNPEEKYSIMAADFFELHHITVLKSRKSDKNTVTSENDVLLLCPNCHRFIHKLMVRYEKQKITLNELKEHIR
jgi:hypothetical protein